uniref:Uncharacterized protein n=1 Tax=Rhinopithecus bieti TaxID=61621 RepID=A0A2K6L9X0_RHIBE
MGQRALWVRLYFSHSWCPPEEDLCQKESHARPCFFKFANLGERGGSRKMLEPGMCPAETSLTPFVTRSLILLCFSVTHRDIPLHFFLQLLAASASASLGLGRETNPLPSLGLSPGLLRETFVSEGPFSTYESHLGATQPPLLLVDEIRWNR